MNNKYIKLATVAMLVFYFSCNGKANANELPDINLDILGNDDNSKNSIDEKLNNSIKSNRIISSKKVILNNSDKQQVLSTKGFMGGAASLDPPTPTLDDVNAQSSAWLDNGHETYELSTETSDGALSVAINGTTYYYTPSENDKETLSNLVATGSIALKETTTADNAVFKFGDKYYTYDSNVLKKSIYTITEGTEDNYNFTTTDGTTTKYWKMAVKATEIKQTTLGDNSAYSVEEGTEADYSFTTPNGSNNDYWNINIKPETLGNNGHVTFSNDETGATGSVTVNLPNEQTQTLYYKHNKPNDYTETNTRINDTLNADNVNKKVFKNITSDENGGAIFNTEDKSDINILSDFIRNKSILSFTDSDISLYGGAIYNTGLLSDITGDFISNHVLTDKGNAGGYSSSSGYYEEEGPDYNNIAAGGAIYNESEIGNLNGDFISNYAKADKGKDSSAYGGAIYNSNSGIIADVTGDFINNKALTEDNNLESSDSTKNKKANGGAIFNSGEMNDITGDFIGNSAFNNVVTEYSNYSDTLVNLDIYGGAIFNSGEINNITGDFIGNSAFATLYSQYSYNSANNNAYGGAIYNLDTIENIIGDFINNDVYANITTEYNNIDSASNTYGGAIYNAGKMNNITGNFTDNNTAINISTYYNNAGINTSAYGGAIYNAANDGTAVIGDITGNFINNNSAINVTASYSYGSINASAYGGAIFNTGKIGNITGDFLNNDVFANLTIENNNSELVPSANGGAIYNAGETGNITGDFIGNNAQAWVVNGGAIYNDGADSSAIIGDINGNFINNYISGKKGHGGAIFNAANDGTAVIGDITGDFIGNHVDVLLSGNGGAIHNVGTIGNITGNFIGNHVENTSGLLLAGAIYNSGEIGNITGDFVNNYLSFSGDINSSSDSPSVFAGGAIYNAGTIGNIEGDFSNNDLSVDIAGNNDNSYVYALGGAIYNKADDDSSQTASISDITGNFINNDAAITITSSYSYATTNVYGGAIYNFGEIGNIDGDFTNNDVAITIYSDYSYASANAYGGAIYNFGEIGNIDGDFTNNDAAITITSSYSYAPANAYGGAIYNKGNIGDITGNFNNNDLIFSGNIASSSEYPSVFAGGAIYNAVKIENIEGDFSNNNLSVETANNDNDSYVYALGGAIYNKADDDSSQVASIGDITGDFSNNNAAITINSGYSYATASAYGGAIYNFGEIGNIDGDFTNNNATINMTSSYSYATASAYGGAIYNEGNIGDITGSFNNNDLIFSGNIASSSDYPSVFAGGAIYNAVKIKNIEGNFTNNNILTNATITGDSSYIYAEGGAIYNSGETDNITGNFSNNNAAINMTSNYSYGNTKAFAYGGAVYNAGTIGNIEGNFTNNDTAISITTSYSYASINADISSHGGAIYNYADESTATIGDITGDFIGNHANVTVGGSQGGAIYNGGIIGNIEGDFNNNYIEKINSNSISIHFDGSDGYSALGGAIANVGTITSIKGDFTENYVKSTNGEVVGGAIHNAGGAVYNKGTIGDITGSFVDNYLSFSGNINSSSDYPSVFVGGALYNAGTIGNIEGDFSNNDLSVDITNNDDNLYLHVQGGAIYNKANDDSSQTASIGSITGDFSNNIADIKITQNTNNSSNEIVAAAFGGAIYNEGEIGDIEGNFNNNKVSVDIPANENSNSFAYGGAIYNAMNDGTATIGDITGDFIGNYAKGKNVNGGAIYNEDEIGNITGDFKNNYIEAIDSNSSSVNFDGSDGYGIGIISGGAISNTGTIGIIKGDFTENYVKTLNSKSIGGAIYNSSEINDITGDFIGNYVLITSDDSTADALGGAIYTTEELNLINSNFSNNYAKSPKGSAKGGAIYTSANLNIIADDATSTFSGNYTEANGVKTPNAIYVGSDSATLTLKAQNSGTITFDDEINGVEGYTLAITGDDTGKVVLNNKVYTSNATLDTTTLYLGVTDSDNSISDVLLNANLTANSGTVDVVDDSYISYNINNLISDESALYNIDLDATNKTSDKFVTTEESSGTITLNELNLSGDFSDWTTDTKVQIIQNTDLESTLQLALSDALLSEEFVIGTDGEGSSTDEEIAAITAWNKEYQTTVISGDTIYGKIGLATTTTDNDSLGIVESRREAGDTTYESMGDTLALVNQADLSSRQFNAVNDGDTYNVTADLGTTAAGTFTINGVEEGNTEIINLDSNSGFVLENATTLNLNNIKLTGNDTLASVSNSNASINLTNVELDGAVSSTVNYTMALAGHNRLNASVGRAQATMDSGSLVIVPDTFATENASLTVNGGTVKLSDDNAVNTYNIYKLTSDANASYNIDFNATNKTSDKIATTAKSSGTVTLNELNLTGDFSGWTADTKVQIIQNTDAESTLQLALSDALNTQLSSSEYVIGNVASSSTDEEIAEITAWNKNYQTTVVAEELIYGKIGLATTTTTNDSLGMNESRRTGGGIIYESMGDTLALVNQADISSRQFNAVNDGDKYDVTANLGSTAAGTFSINGVEGGNTEIVDLKNFDGFSLSNASTLNLNNIKLTGNDTLASVSNSNASINLTNVEFDGAVSGAVNYTMALAGNNKLNASVGKAQATMNSGSLVFAPNSFATTNASLTTNGGSVNLVDGSYTDYNINKLVSDENANYNLDIVLNSTEQIADTFTVGNGSSGIVKLSTVNIDSNVPDNTEYIVQIIKAPDNNNAPQLYVDDSQVTDTARAVMNSTDIIAAGFSVYTKDTTNDSLRIKGARNVFTEWSEHNAGDEDKQFTFVDNGNYNIDQDINLTGKNIEIIGNNNSLDINNKSFLDNISNEQNIKISGVNIENSNDITNEGSLELKDTSIDADITNENDVKIQGKSKLSGKIVNNNSISIEDAELELDNELTSASDDNKLDILNSKVNLKKLVSDQNITITGSDINLSDVNKFIDNNVYINSGNLNVNDLGLNTLAFNHLALNGGNINIDSVKADLANNKMGNIKANSYADNPQGNINVNNIIVTSDATKATTALKFVDKELKNNVKSNVKKVSGPIYKYNVNFSNDDEFGEDGYFKFVKDDNGGNKPTPEPTYNEFNPALFVAPVAAQLGGYTAMLNNYDDALRNMDTYMMMTKTQRQAYKLKNKYAAAYSDTLPYDNSPTLYSGFAINSKPSTTFEKVKLKNGPKVSNVTYGTLEVLESPMYEMKHGFDGMWGVYAAYNGSHQSYHGNSIYQNGGSLGLVGMAYKNNFFAGITANVGANIANASTNFGDEDFGMFTTGVAAKTGYNFEFNDGKFVIQPSYMMSYSFINTEDYRNAAGVKIKSDPLHAISMEPGIRFVANLKNGWQPYAGASVVINALDKTNFKANDVSLPELSIKPYAKYGVGVRKTMGDKASGYLQTYVTNGGRNGVGIQAGFRWTLGNSPKSSYADSISLKNKFANKNSNKNIKKRTHQVSNSLTTVGNKKYIKGSNIPTDNSKFANN